MQLYLHIPFCKSKCRYCDFNSYACRDEQAIFEYLNALNKEFDLASEWYKDEKIDTVYVGGGTPSLLQGSLCWSLLNNLACAFDLQSVKEWTIECNPESLTEEKLKLYKDVGVNRISLGVQSLDNNNLKAVGRLHTSNQALEKLELAGKYFDNVSADLIVGLPYDSEDIVKRQVETFANLTSHISMYELMLEEGTALDKMVKSGKISLPDDDRVQELFDVAFDTACANGFERYEVSNFARDGKISHHNYGYWTREEYLGFGAGAHSLVKIGGEEQRYCNFCSLNDYKKAVENADDFWKIARDETQILTQKDIRNERIMLGLRTQKGVKECDMLKVPQNLEIFFKREGGYVSLTRKGMNVMNSILTEILDI